MQSAGDGLIGVPVPLTPPPCLATRSAAGCGDPADHAKLSHKLPEAGGSSDWGPSQRAWSGSGWTSTMTPAAPTTNAALAMGVTRSRRPSAWLGSTITGRCVTWRRKGHDAQVQGVAERPLEGADPPLAQDDLFVSLQQDVLGRGQELLERGAHAPLQEHRLADAADLFEEVEVLHVAGADLQAVGDGGDRIQLVDAHHLGDDGQPDAWPASTRYSSPS